MLVRKTETLDFWVRFFLNRALEGNAEGREAKDAGNASADSPVSMVPWFLLGPCSATGCTAGGRWVLTREQALELYLKACNCGRVA